MMKQIMGIAGTIVLAAMGAAAQDEVQQKALMEKLKVEIQSMTEATAKLGVMAQPVLGAPFSGTEVNEETQTLADGTKIHHESQTQVYRDGAGRTRREMGNTVVIMDPVAKMRYTINHERKTVTAVNMGFVKMAPAGERAGIGIAAGANDQVVTYTMDTGNTERVMSSAVVVKDGKVAKKEIRGNTEDLGPQTMEGVVANGTRLTRTIETGAIGNDRPINSVSERWYSPQLQTMMMTKQTDPRSGENIFRLTNVKLGEPDPSLFQVPAGYQVIESRAAARKE